MVRIKKGVDWILKKARTSVCNQPNLVSKPKQASVEQTLGVVNISKKARTSVCNQPNLVSKPKQASVEQTLGGKYGKAHWRIIMWLWS